MGDLGRGPDLDKVSTKFNYRRNDIRSIILSMGGHYIADCSSDDADIPEAYQHCRYAEVDVEGIVKVDYLDDNGQTHTLVCNAIAGVPVRVSRITRVYQYYTGVTACTVQVYNVSGSLVTGIRLCL